MEKNNEMTREEINNRIIYLMEKLGMIPPAPAQDPEEGKGAERE